MIHMTFVVAAGSKLQAGFITKMNAVHRWVVSFAETIFNDLNLHRTAWVDILIIVKRQK